MEYKLLVLLLIALLTSSFSEAGEANLSWTPPTLNDDGSLLTDLASYEIWHGCSQSGSYTDVEVILAPASTHIASGLPDIGTCYFAAKATNSAGVSSVFSNESSKLMGALELPGIVDDTTITWAESQDMPATFVGSNSASSSTGTVPSVTHGLTILENDVVVAVIYVNNSNENITLISGFTEDYQANTSQTATISVQTKVAGAPEPASYSSSKDTSTRWAMYILVFRGVNTTTPIDVTTVADSGPSSNSVVSPSIIVAANAVGIAVATQDTGSGSMDSVDNGYTGLITEPNQISGVSYRIFTTGGATGDVITTSSLSIGWDALHLSLAVAAAGGANPKGPLGMVLNGPFGGPL